MIRKNKLTLSPLNTKREIYLSALFMVLKILVLTKECFMEIFT